MVNAKGATIPATASVALSDAFLRHTLTPGMRNRVFIDELPSSVMWPFAQGPYLTTFTLQSRFELAMRRVLLHQATALQSLRRMQDEINGEIRTQRKVPDPRPFAGSFLSWFLAAACIGCCISAGLRLQNRKRTVPSGER